jgi:hypothetical protein
MTAADKRVEQLLDRWMASLELHARYLQLDDAGYAEAEAWPKHQRPTRWVIDLARKQLRELQAHLAERTAADDPHFSEALELMSFLTGLLGSEHLERFIPLATGKPPPDPTVPGTAEQPRPRGGRGRPSSSPGTSGTSVTSGTSRQSVPKPSPGSKSAPTPAQRMTAPRPMPGRGEPAARPPSQPASRAAPAPPAEPARAATAIDARSGQVIADAVRMLEWGREWPALAGLIARMADRPSEQDIWEILRAHRSEILAKARRPAN